MFVISPNTVSTPKNEEQHSAQVCNTETEAIGVIASEFFLLSEEFT